MSEPVITRVVAVEELPPGSPATRRLIAAWSDGTESEALAWFSDEWLVSEGDLIGLTGRSQGANLTLRRARRADPVSGAMRPSTRWRRWTSPERWAESGVDPFRDVARPAEQAATRVAALLEEEIDEPTPAIRSTWGRKIVRLDELGLKRGS